jgi:hypothetical protein
MTKTRKSFLLHIDSLDILDELTDEEAGELFKAIKDYQNDDDLNLKGLVRIAFSPFKNQFVRDSEKYNLTCERRAQAGSKGGKQKVANASKSKQKQANLAESVSKNKSDSKNDSKNESDSKNDKDSDKHKQLDILVQSKIDRDKFVSDAFVYFWSNMHLPKKAKPVGEKSFTKAVNKVDDPMHFAKFLVTDTETRFNNQQIGFDKMHPSTYLNQTRWEDDHTIDKPQNEKVKMSGGGDWAKYGEETF